MSGIDPNWTAGQAVDQAALDSSYSENSTFSDAFLRAIPKTDLHVHLDGSVRLSTIIDLAEEAGLELPSQTEAGLRDLVFKPKYESLEEYLECFRYTVAVMQTAPHLERIAYEFACDNYSEGVLYFEVRFAPQLHAGPDLDIEGVLKAVHKGLERAKGEFNAKEEVVHGRHPHFDYAIIVCAMRFFTAEFSKYYRSFCEVHKHESAERLYGLASMALVTSAVAAKDSFGIPIVALDIAGAERGFPAVAHAEAYRYAHKRFLNKTVHAGEGYGPESIFQAITDLNAERIGHGFHLFHENMIQHPDKLIMTPTKYASGLAQYVAEHRITLEVCLSSNLQTIPELAGCLKNHPFLAMLDHRLSLSLNTDNRLVSHTSVCRELRLACDAFELNPKQMKDIVIGSFKRSFSPKQYVFKRHYVRQVINYYEAMEKRFAIHEQDADGRKDSILETSMFETSDGAEKPVYKNRESTVWAPQADDQLPTPSNALIFFWAAATLPFVLSCYL